MGANGRTGGAYPIRLLLHHGERQTPPMPGFQGGAFSTDCPAFLAETTVDLGHSGVAAASPAT